MLNQNVMIIIINKRAICLAKDLISFCLKCSRGLQPKDVFISAVKRLMVINHIQNKSFFYIIYECVLCIFINTHMQ